MLDNPASRVLATRARLFREDLLPSLRKRLWIAGREDDACLPDHGAAVTDISRHAGHAAGHGLDQHVRQTLAIGRGQCQEVERRIDVVEAAPLAKQHTFSRETKLPNQRPYRLRIAAGP